MDASTSSDMGEVAVSMKFDPDPKVLLVSNHLDENLRLTLNFEVGPRSLRLKPSQVRRMRPFGDKFTIGGIPVTIGDEVKIRIDNPAVEKSEDECPLNCVKIQMVRLHGGARSFNIFNNYNFAVQINYVIKTMNRSKLVPPHKQRYVAVEDEEVMVDGEIVGVEPRFINLRSKSLRQRSEQPAEEPNHAMKPDEDFEQHVLSELRTIIMMARVSGLKFNYTVTKPTGETLASNIDLNSK